MFRESSPSQTGRFEQARHWRLSNREQSVQESHLNELLFMNLFISLAAALRVLFPSPFIHFACRHVT